MHSQLHPNSLPFVLLNAVDLMDEREAATYLKIAPGTLANWRHSGRHDLPFTRVGKSIRYSRKALQAWLESRTKGATT